jgi:hypothetical protein
LNEVHDSVHHAIKQLVTGLSVNDRTAQMRLTWQTSSGSRRSASSAG